MLRLLRAYIMNVVYYRWKARCSAKYRRYANSMYCNVLCYKELACAGACALISRLPANVGKLALLLPWYSEIQTQNHIVTDSKCQPEHFSPVGVLLTESRCCLDQLATITSPSIRLGNLRMVLSRDQTKVFKSRLRPIESSQRKWHVNCVATVATENNIEVFVVQILYRLVRTAQALHEGSCLCFLHPCHSCFLTLIQPLLWEKICNGKQI